MSESVVSAGGSVEARLGRIADEFTDRCNRGESPDVEEYAARHPEIAGLLRQVLPALQVAVSLASGGGAHQQPVGPEPEPGYLGDFRIIREVGRGGMGVVFEAEQLSLGRRVALKVLPFASTMDPRQLARFHNEARAAGGLHHTNIVPVHAVGCERGVHYYAMQFIEGRTLAELITEQRGGPPSKVSAGDAKVAACATTAPPAARGTSPALRDVSYFRRVAEWGTQAAQALDCAHSLGVVHRDVKPGNLMVDATGRLWVTDFGLARVVSDSGLTMTGDLLGTLRYMSPEQALGKHGLVDHRTDVYSLGVTLYELLTLRPAIDGADREEVVKKIALEEPAAPRRLNRAVPAELETIVLKAMAKEPAERYGTAQELADDLRCFLEDRPIRARRPALPTRLARWGRRHKPLMTAVAAALVMGLAVLAGSIGWVARDREARRTKTMEGVAAALKESASWQEQRRLPEALSAARRAHALLAGADVDEALRQQVRARLADLELLDRLEIVRLEKQTAVQDGHFDWKGADELYGQTFRDAGLDVETLPAEEAGDRLRKSTVAVELAGVLDHWAMVRRNARGARDASWRHLLRLAREADPDALRAKVREALEHRDARALRALAASEGVLRLPVATLSVLGYALLGDKGVRGQAEAFLRKAQRRHPNDFWLNHTLFLHFNAMPPPPREEAVRFAALAVGLRPASPGAHLNLGIALMNNRKGDEAIAEFREAIRLKRDYAEAHSRLGFLLSEQGKVDEAIAACKEALRIRKNDPQAHSNLGVALRAKGRHDEAIAELRTAIRLGKGFPDAHNNLGIALQGKGRLDEAIREYRRALQLKEDYAAAHSNLGAALYARGDLDGALAHFRRAVDLDPGYALFHGNLGAALAARGRRDEALAHFRKAVDLDPKSAGAHTNLGNALRLEGRLDEAIAEYREAIRLKEDYPEAHHNLGVALQDKGRLGEAIAEFREVIRLKKDYPEAHNNLGIALAHKGRLDEAIAEFRQTVRLKKDFPEAHYNLGNALYRKGRLGETIACYREAIRIKPEYAEAHCNLGHALRQKGEFRQALRALRRGHELGSKNPRWPHPSAQWLRQAEQLAALDDRLAAALAGKVEPKDAPERLSFAQLCQQYRQRYAAAARFYAEAFAAQPKLAEAPQAGHRYDAARAAALAGCGQGQDAAGLTAAERARLRRQALDWLRADLAAYRQLLEKSAGTFGGTIAKRMQQWLKDEAFAGVRGPDALARLPGAERQGWQKLWEEVEALRRRAAERPAAERSARP